jgi:hypothetical protein
MRVLMVVRSPQKAQGVTKRSRGQCDYRELTWHLGAPLSDSFYEALVGGAVVADQQ